MGIQQERGVRREARLRIGASGSAGAAPGRLVHVVAGFLLIAAVAAASIPARAAITMTIPILIPVLVLMLSLE